MYWERVAFDEDGAVRMTVRPAHRPTETSVPAARPERPPDFVERLNLDSIQVAFSLVRSL
jgi:hypothetical protein